MRGNIHSPNLVGSCGFVVKYRTAASKLSFIPLCLSEETLKVSMPGELKDRIDRHPPVLLLFTTCSMT